MSQSDSQIPKRASASGNAPGNALGNSNTQGAISLAHDNTARPDRSAAMEAVRTLIRWAGDDPAREGLKDTPGRVVDAYDEFFAGYRMDAKEILSRTFEEVEGYDDMVMLRNIRVESHCEHHIVPILGTAHIAYMPRDRVVGISKLARVVDVFAKRLQTQETMTAQIADAIADTLNPRGIAILIAARHQCMTTRGVHRTEADLVTSSFTGVFETDAVLRERFMAQAGFNASAADHG